MDLEQLVDYEAPNGEGIEYKRKKRSKKRPKKKPKNKPKSRPKSRPKSKPKKPSKPKTKPKIRPPKPILICRICPRCCSPFPIPIRPKRDVQDSSTLTEHSQLDLERETQNVDGIEFKRRKRLHKIPNYKPKPKIPSSVICRLCPRCCFPFPKPGPLIPGPSNQSQGLQDAIKQMLEKLKNVNTRKGMEDKKERKIFSDSTENCNYAHIIINWSILLCF